MARTVELSDSIVLDAMRTAELTGASLAEQIEYWAALGRAMERILHTDEALALKQRGELAPLSALLDLEDGAQAQAFRERFAERLATLPVGPKGASR